MLDIQYLLLRQKKLNYDSGFTLIELLVVVIIVGILAAISIPTFMGQVGKARETEAKTNIGAMAHAQQIYHYEQKKFADTLDKLSSGATFTSKYYNIPDPDIANYSILKQRITSTDAINNGTRNYALGIYYSAGSYGLTVCQSANIGGSVEVPDNIADTCTNSGTKIK